MPTLDVLQNGMVGMHSTMSSSIYEMSSILAQSQLQEQVKKKTLKSLLNNEKQ
jgi:fluoride ion exporter CrcB/FEX